MPYLVCHAHAGDKRAWAGPDGLRPLSVHGRQEAHGLLTQLRDYPVNRILSSPAVRCLQIVEPLAQRRDLPVEPTETLAVHADPAALLALVSDPAAAETVLCSHGELIGAVIGRLLASSPNGDSPTWPKGSTWVLEVDGGQLLRSRFLPPLRLQDTDAGCY